jgi:hypothetical protein
MEADQGFFLGRKSFQHKHNLKTIGRLFSPVLDQLSDLPRHL